MAAHKVTTSERQGGYMAHCDCGEITYGGFSTRTEARAALLGHEEAPGALQGDEGESTPVAAGENNSESNHQEGITVNNIIPLPKPKSERISTVLAEARVINAIAAHAATVRDSGGDIAEALEFVNDFASANYRTADGAVRVVPASEVPVTAQLIKDVLSGRVNIIDLDGGYVVISDGDSESYYVSDEPEPGHGSHLCVDLDPLALPEHLRGDDVDIDRITVEQKISHDGVRFVELSTIPGPEAVSWLTLQEAEAYGRAILAAVAEEVAR